MRLIKQKCEREATYPPLLEIPQFEKLMGKIPKDWHGFALCKLYGKRHTAQPKKKKKGRKPMVSVMKKVCIRK